MMPLLLSGISVEVAFSHTAVERAPESDAVELKPWVTISDCQLSSLYIFNQ